MPASPRPSVRETAMLGALAGLAASGAQSAIGFVIDRALLPPEHDNNISPRLINRTGRKLGLRTHPIVEWVLGVGFHFGYGLGWGVLYALTRERFRVPPPALGGAFGGLIYLVAFSPIGIGTRTRTEEHPRRRDLPKQLDLLAIPFAYALPLAFLYEQLGQRLARSAAQDPAEAPPEPGRAAADQLAGPGQA